MNIGRKGVIGLPVRLTVAFLIISISVPVLTGMAADLKEDNAVMSASKEADRIADAVSRVYYMGAGSACAVDVSLPAGCMMAIGGEGTDAYSIGIFLDGVEKDRIYLERPLVRILGDGLDVHGKSRISVECVRLDGVYGVSVGIDD